MIVTTLSCNVQISVPGQSPTIIVCESSIKAIQLANSLKAAAKVSDFMSNHSWCAGSQAQDLSAELKHSLDSLAS